MSCFSVTYRTPLKTGTNDALLTPTRARFLVKRGLERAKKSGSCWEGSGLSHDRTACAFMHSFHSYTPTKFCIAHTFPLLVTILPSAVLVSYILVLLFSGLLYFALFPLPPPPMAM